MTRETPADAIDAEAPPAIDAATGIVLAGGRARRFGRDKLAEPVGGRAIVDRAIDAVVASCGEVVVVLGPAGELPEPIGRPRPPHRAVRDAEPAGGPLVGLLTGLGSTATPLAIVVGGDMPSLVPAVLAELLAEVAGGAHAAILDLPDTESTPPSAARTTDLAPAAVVGPTEGRDLALLPLALRVDKAGEIAGALVGRGERRLGALVRALEPARVPWARWGALDPAAATLRDIDAPADLADLVARPRRRLSPPR